MSRSNKPRFNSVRREWFRFNWKKRRSEIITPNYFFRPSRHGLLRWFKRNGNQRIRQEVRQRLKDVLFTDAFDEKELVGSKRAHIFDWWRYD